MKELEMHNGDIEDAPPFVCRVCEPPQRFGSRSDFVDHLNAEHETP